MALKVSKVVDFVNRKPVCNFLLVFDSNLGPILAPFQRYHRFSAENSDLTPIPPEFWRCSPSTRLPTLCLRGAKSLG